SGALIPDGAGGFYSTCQKGSDNGAGVIARIAADGTTTQVYRFDRHTRGVPGGPAMPLGAPVLGPDGKLYGWTTYGGANTCTLGGDLQTAGCVFVLDPATGLLEVLHSFESYESPWNADNSPLQSVLLASDGNLYGTHQHAGANGSGIVWRLELPSRAFTVLHTFGPRNATAVPRFKNDDGALPLGTLVEDRYGFLYGTCSMGGDFGHGTIFQLSRDGAQFVTLHSLGYGAGGHHPHAGVVIVGSQGFGTCFAGGDSVDANGQGGFGTVFAFTLPNTVHGKVGVEPGVMVESDPIRVGCVTAPTVKATAPAEYSVNGGMWMSAVGAIAPGDELRIRAMSSTTTGKRVLAGYSIGFQSGSFAITTRT
ncbi:MAG TPA: choice-of-anchor tandem repeat GloVer-containing protein, partial [Kofleriaceae bacterium]